MANLVVWAEIRRGAITAASRHAVGEARRIANRLGATVYALMAMGMIEESEIEAHAFVLGEAGADRILCCEHPSLEGPVVDATAGAWLAGIARRLRPLLTLLPAGSAGWALGPPLALRLEGLFHPRAALTVAAGEEGHGARLLVSRFRPTDGASRTVEPGRDGAVVATLPAGPDPGRRGRAAREVEMLAFDSTGAPSFRELTSEPDELEAIELASGLVALGADASASDTAAMRAAVPAGTVVIGEAERHAALDLACPARLLVAGKGTTSLLARRALAPSTRVAVVGPKRADKDLGRIDVVWRPVGSDGLATLAPALGEAAPTEDTRS